MKKLNYALLISGVIAFIAYKSAVQKKVSDVLTTGAGALAQTVLEEAIEHIPSGLETFDEYNQSSYKQIDGQQVSQFLDEQIKDLGLHPEDFRYLVGDAWSVVSLPSGKYGLVLPSALPSNIDTIKMIAGAPYAPLYTYNVVDLSDKLRQQAFLKDRAAYNRYRLEIRKALIEAAGKMHQSELADFTAPIAFSVAETMASQMGLGVEHVISLLSGLYPYATGHKAWTELQEKIDADVLKTHDIGLIEARIADMEDQLKSEKESYIATAYRYLPVSLQSHEKSALEKRLDEFKHYLDDNRFELKMYQKFIENARKKKGMKRA